MNLLPALLFGGPPHAGKSILFYHVTKALRERGIPHYALRACPDGEGNWSHELDQGTVRLIRVKGTWSDVFRQQVAQDLERRHLPLLVDLGGLPSEADACILRNCTHSVLLLRSDQPEATFHWQHLMQANGVSPLAELFSELTGPSWLTSEQPIITGHITGLKNGSSVQGEPFMALVERITLLFTSFTLEKLEDTKLAQAPAELVINLGSFLQRYTPTTQHWECPMLINLLAELPAQIPLAVYGPGPNWLYAALAAHTGLQPFYQFDPRIGWITPPGLRLSNEPVPEIEVQFENHEHITILSIRLLHDYFDYPQADQLPFPPVPLDRGLILDGRLPLWLLLIS